MACNPTLCPDCPYPPNFSISELLKNADNIMRYEIECRECGDVWVELDDEAGE